MLPQFQAIVGSTSRSRTGEVLGHSRAGRAVLGFRVGRGVKNISLLGGCHADEPVGPWLLGHLVSYLSTLPTSDPLFDHYTFWIVPHINPDGAQANRYWQQRHAGVFDIAKFLSHVVREAPGDDIEFGFPVDVSDRQCRPETRAVYDWWSTCRDPFALHVSLHGMAFAAGPWFLIDHEWSARCDALKEWCRTRVDAMGYRLHDVQRNGEKGFVRLGPGFCTRPDSRNMRKHFTELGDLVTAQLFRPSSMETIRGLGGDPLTLVSEMPLFITPGVGHNLGPPDPEAIVWKGRIDGWRQRLAADGEAASDVRIEAVDHGLTAMPVRDQMELQWAFICAGVAQIDLDT